MALRTDRRPPAAGRRRHRRRRRTRHRPRARHLGHFRARRTRGTSSIKLRRLIGGAAVMRSQLSFIKQMATSQRITLRALPFTAGAHDSLDSSFLLLGFQDDEDVLYVAGPNGVLTNRDNREMVAHYQECFEDLTDKSLSEEATISLLDELLEQLRDS
ncbi:Scr1 family TA system antitoxin-like transcriptional regulator [Streptomyces tendae]|uniref:Scr1 family TA system antitoxin-like transcriptional regulator n=1 Tax=Streptomyces tendae TaxID=1932 RepID=UPI0036A36267